LKISTRRKRVRNPASAAVIRRLQKKNEAAVRLLDSWLADDSGYDERVWPVLKRSLDANRLSTRKLFRWQAHSC